MIVSEISTSQCRGCRGGAHRCRLVELLKVVWVLDWQDDGPSGIAVFGGEEECDMVEPQQAGPAASPGGNRRRSGRM
jgi:hypothetical protein